MRTILASLALLLVATTASAAKLTDTEQRWLHGARPVIEFARRQGLPLDIVVQPQTTAGLSPLGLAFVDGRCKLVLSMRGNPEAEALLERAPPGLQAPAIELMAAHELGHCRRYIDGAWSQLPAGFAPAAATEAPANMPPDLQAAYREMQRARREEGYGDLVGLAWTQQRHAADYTRLHAWLLAERLRERLPGSHHDTLAWLRLTAGGVGDSPSPFDAATELWIQGLGAEE